MPASKPPATGYGWAPIVKREKLADGTLLVSGPVADSGLDRDFQVCDSEWLNKAVPAWFAESGNVREMHAPIAAGKALTYDPADHSISARIVDPSSIAKVENDVLTGFSIGIKRPRIVPDAEAPGGRIVDGSIIEVSLVDRPANPRCLLTMAKSDSNGELQPVETPELVETTSPEDATPTVEPVVEPAAVEPAPAAAAVNTAHGEQIRALLTDPDAAATRFAAVTARAQGKAAADTPALGKASSVDGGLAVFKAVAALLIQEATDLAAGDWTESYDVSVLLDVLAALKCFLANEADEATEDAAAADDDLGGSTSEAVAAAVSEALKDTPLPGGVASGLIALADTPDLVKALVGDEGALTTLADAITAKMTTVTQDAITKAVEPLTQRLAKVEAAPAAGGPVRTRTHSEQASADDLDRQSLEQELVTYLDKAERTEDRQLAEGYRQLADRTRDRITALR